MLTQASARIGRLASVRWRNAKPREPIRNRATFLRHTHRSECSGEYIHRVMRSQNQNCGNFE